MNEAALKQLKAENMNNRTKKIDYENWTCKVT